jgi:hypothetical protein
MFSGIVLLGCLMSIYKMESCVFMYPYTLGSDE